MLVQEVMTPEPYVAFAKESLRTVLGKLAEADVRHLPVCEGQSLVGIVSDRDLRQAMPLPVQADARPQEAARIMAQPVSSIMSTDVITVNPGDDLVDAIDLMIEHRVGALPVVDAGSAKLLGIVSYVDALRAARDVLARE